MGLLLSVAVVSIYTVGSISDVLCVVRFGPTGQFFAVTHAFVFLLRYVRMCYKQTAERVIKRAVGNTRLWFVGNAPIGHYLYEYPVEMRTQRNAFGAKVFFSRAQWIEGTIKLETKLYKDYAWIAR